MKKIIYLLLLCSLSLFAERVYATFDVKPYRSANITFSAGGIVQQIYTDTTQEVRQGETLAALDNDDLKAKLTIAQIAMEHAKKEYKRQLSIKETVQQSKLDLYKFQYDNAEAQITYIHSLLNKTILKAPFDGTIAIRKIEVGDVVSGVAPRTAFVLQSSHKRKLLVTYDQRYWHKVQLGNAFNYTLDGDSTVHHGVISKIYPQANSQNRKLTAEVLAKDYPVGLFGKGEILLPDEDEK